MKQSIFKQAFILLFATFLFVQTFSQINLQQPEQLRVEEVKQIDQLSYRQKYQPEQQEISPSLEDPFKGKGHHKDKRHHSGDVKKGKKISEQGEQKIYKPFPTKDEQQQQDQNDGFAQMLFWGMSIGSVFLAVVLCKSCMKKRGRCERRRQIAQINLQQSSNPYDHYVHGNYNQVVRMPVQGRPYQQVQERTYGQVQERRQGQVRRQGANISEIDNKIQKYEAQLNQLKQIKQKSLKEESLRKNHQRQIPIEKVYSQNQNYGPRYYGDKNLERKPYQQGTDYSLSSNQPFQVQGIDPILPRRRVNSIQTEIVESERNGVYYRNGIPIGKPLNQQDNDSSFASQYPEI